MNKIRKLVVLTAKVEDNLSPLQKLKLARKQLQAATDASKDKAKESSKQLEDNQFEKNQKDVNEDTDSLLK